MNTFEMHAGGRIDIAFFVCPYIETELSLKVFLSH